MLPKSDSMLEKVLGYLRNFFIAPNGVHSGKFSIEGGEISLPFLHKGQYFRICGSVFNDGVHMYPAANLTDEVFIGTVSALAIPQEVIELSEDIKKYEEQNGSVPSPFASESFGGYSYTKATDASGAPLSWQSVFRSRLNRWRKL